MLTNSQNIMTFGLVCAHSYIRSDMPCCHKLLHFYSHSRIP